MARRPFPILAVALAGLLLCSPAWAQGQEFPAKHSYANAPVSIGQSSRRPAEPPQPQRSRLPPVTLAQHMEPVSDDPISDNSAADDQLGSNLEQPSEPQELEPADEESSGAIPLRLSRPQTSPEGSGSKSSPINASSSLITVGTSLAVVLGLFFVMSYFIRRNLPKSVQAPPGEVLEVLGRAPLPGKQQLQVVRFGSKLVLLSVTADGVEAVSEITEPDEVQQLTALCRRESPGSSAHAFQEILAQMGREPAKGFLGQQPTKPQLSRR